MSGHPMIQDPYRFGVVGDGGLVEALTVERFGSGRPMQSSAEHSCTKGIAEPSNYK